MQQRTHVYAALVWCFVACTVSGASANPPELSKSAVQSASRSLADRASAMLAEAQSLRAAGRPGWGDRMRRAAAMYAYAGQLRDSIEILLDLVNEPETDFDLVDGLRQLAQDQADAAGRLDGPPLDAAGTTYDRLRRLVDQRPELRDRFATVLGMAYAREVGYWRHVRREPGRAKNVIDRFGQLDPQRTLASHRRSVAEAAPPVLLEAGDPDAALRAYDRLLAEHPEVLDRFDRRASWELWRLNVVDPSFVADETVVALERLADKALQINEPSQWNLARRLIDARLARGEADEAYACALRLIHRIDELRGDPARAAHASSDQPWTPASDRLRAVEVDVLNRLEDAHLVGRPDIRLFALTRLQALTDDPARKMDYARRIQDLQQAQKPGN